VLQANCGENQLVGEFFLSWPKNDLMLLDYIYIKISKSRDLTDTIFLFMGNGQSKAVYQM